MFTETVALLREGGHDIEVVEHRNDQIDTLAQQIQAAVQGVYSWSAKRELAARLRSCRAEVAHVHNVYPSFSTSVFDACVEANVPVVARLADFTYLCPTSHRFRNGAECRLCDRGREYQCVRTNCRGLLTWSVAYAVRTAVTRVRRALDAVTIFVAPSRYVKDQFAATGIATSRIEVVPNFVPVSDVSRKDVGNYVAYAGRVAEEKGIDVLLEAVQRAALPLVIAGRPSKFLRARSLPRVTFTGWLDRRSVLDVMARARVIAVPSLCSEAFGLVAAEAMGQGCAVVASDAGALPEIVDHEHTGLVVPRGDIDALAVALRRIWDDPALARTLGEHGRRKAAASYSPSAHRRRLEDVFARVRRTVL